MLSDVFGQLVVLLVLEGAWIMGTVLLICCAAMWIRRTVPVIKQEVNDRGIVEETMNIGADTVVGL